MNRHYLADDAVPWPAAPTELRMGQLDGQWVTAAQDPWGWIVLATTDRIPADVVAEWQTFTPATDTTAHGAPSVMDEVFHHAHQAAASAAAAADSGLEWDAGITAAAQAAVDTFLLVQLRTLRGGA